jgi:hypothetical protein
MKVITFMTKAASPVRDRLNPVPMPMEKPPVPRG